jgi:hypothetical protein
VGVPSPETISGVESHGIWEDGGSDDGNFSSEFAAAIFFAPSDFLSQPFLINKLV